MELNIFNEYLRRTGIDIDFIKFPCSFMVASNVPKDVIFITLYKEKHNYEVNHWMLSEEIEELPNKKSFLVKEIIDNDKVILKGFSILDFTPTPAPAFSKNTYREPMFGYEEYFSRFLFDNHFKKRQLILWDYFKRSNIKRTIPISVRTQFGFAYARIDPYKKLSLEQAYIKKEQPKKWSIWNSWRIEMLNLNPGEFYFQSSYARINNT